jgi:hypothetical protein
MLHWAYFVLIGGGVGTCLCFCLCNRKDLCGID